MELIGKASTQTFVDDLLKLSYNIATVSDRSGNDDNILAFIDLLDDIALVIK